MPTKNVFYFPEDPLRDFQAVNYEMQVYEAKDTLFCSLNIYLSKKLSRFLDLMLSISEEPYQIEHSMVCLFDWRNFCLNFLYQMPNQPLEKKDDFADFKSPKRFAARSLKAINQHLKETCNLPPIPGKYRKQLKKGFIAYAELALSSGLSSHPDKVKAASCDISSIYATGNAPESIAP